MVSGMILGRYRHETRLLDKILQKKLGSTGNIIWDKSNLSNTLITGIVFGKRRGSPKSAIPKIS